MSEGVGAAELVRQLDAKTISAEEFAQDVIKREEEKSDLNAITSFDPDLLIQNAQLCDTKRSEGRNGALCGVPLAVKDNINTVAYPTTAGTGALQNHTPERNAGTINRILSAGAFVGCKTGMHELAFGITSNNGVTGAVRNPCDPTKIPGGSSGGTAAAVRAGIFPSGLGTDTGASVRLPAALCGAVGFRPTVGRYPRDGVVPISHTRDTVGPIATSVEDVALLDSVLAAKDQISSHMNMQDVVFGIPTAFMKDLDPAVETAVQGALNTLEAAGAKLMEVDVDSILALNDQVGFQVALYEVMRDLPAYLREHAKSVSFDELIEKIGSPDVAGVFASQLGNEAMPEAAYRAAMGEHRPAMQAAYADLFKANSLTALAFPTSPICARDIGEDETVALNGKQVPTMGTFIRHTDFGSNLAVPGISLPCPDISELPVGIELEGLSNRDEDLISLAFSVETALSN